MWPPQLISVPLTDIMATVEQRISGIEKVYERVHFRLAGKRHHLSFISKATDAMEAKVDARSHPF